MKLNKAFYMGVIFCLLAAGRVCADEVELLTWGQSIREAAKNHPDLISSVESIKQTEAVKQQVTSGLFPQIDASLSASTGKTAAGNKTVNAYDYGVSGTQLIFDGAKTANNVKAALLDIDASRQGFRFTSSTVRFRLRSAFIDLLKAQEMQRINDEIYQLRRGNLELITLRYQSGLEHKGALLLAEADLAEAKYGINQTRRAFKVAQEEMTKEMGRKNFTPLRVSGSLEVKETVEEEPDFARLAKNNPSWQQLDAQRRAAEFILKSTYGNYWPQITGSAGAGRAGSHWAPNDNRWDLGVSLAWPLFEGGLRKAQVKEQQAVLRQLEENQRSSWDAAVLSLEQNWAALRDAVEDVLLQAKVLEAAVERSRIAQAQYAIGFISFDNWTIIEDNLVSAKRKFLDSQAQALLAEARWIQAKGETIDYE